MKRIFTLLVLLIITTALFAQWNPETNYEGKCSHIPKDMPRTLDYLYDWQSPLMDNYDVTFYFLDIEVSSESTFVGGNVTIHATAEAPIDTIAFELIEVMEIQTILVNETEYSDYTREMDNVLVPVDLIDEGSSFTLQVFYEGDPGSGGFFSGLSKAFSEQYQTSVVWTLSEPFAAKEWFPVKQDLEDKADSCWVFLTTDAGNMAGSQGLLTAVVEVGNDKVRYEWKSRYPIDYYLISFAVADYQEYNIYAHPEGLEGDSILVQNFIYDAPGCLENYKEEIDETVPMIELFSDLFSMYPFPDEKYGHCLTQLGGGMEHQTMTTIGGFGFGLVSHELGHMWFGDHVTCATWSDIWINEGFATYSNGLAEEYLHGWGAGKAFYESCQNSAMSQPGGSTYIPEEEIREDNVWRIFSGRLSYRKGAAILHTLRHEIQDDSLFFAVMKTFQMQFADSTATGDDFRQVAEEVTGMDFEQFFAQWYYGEGYPIFNYEYYMVDGNFHLTATQTSSASSTPLFQLLMDYKLFFEDGTDTVVQFFHTDNINTFELFVGKEVTNVVVDPESWTMEQVSNISVTLQETEWPVYFSAGPNPVKDHLNIYLMNPAVKERILSVYDISGRMLLEKTIHENSEVVDMSSFQKGVYLISVSDHKQEFIRKVIR
jgi:aminopeptidase N